MPPGVRRNALVTAVTILLALAAAAVAYAGNAGGLLPPSGHSPNASRITDAYLFIVVFTGVIFVLVEGALLLFVVKYRRGRRARTAEGPQVHGSTRLETIWTVLPVLVLAAIGTFVFYKLPGISSIPKASAGDETRITIEGRQFYWLFKYPNGAVSIDRMRAPVNEVVREEVVSPDDGVNHSWWPRELSGKTDAIAGQTNETWFKADQAREYEVRCAELCGVQHALMNGVVDVLPRDEYARWVRHRAANPRGLDLGREEWTGVCSKCHRLDHQYIGPALGGNPLLADRKGLEKLVRNGQGMMPAVGSGWTDAQIDALVAYTKRFAKGGAGGGRG
jgi:cytochrome c oxidase subunit 2